MYALVNFNVLARRLSKNDVFFSLKYSLATSANFAKKGAVFVGHTW